MPKKKERREGNPIKILLIEDNPGDVRLIQEILGDKNDVSFDLEWAGRLEAGLKRLDNGDFDLVLLDLGLPDSQGLYTFLKIISQEQRMPIIVLTGLEDETLGINAVRAGAQDYIVKGQLDRNLLVRAIRYAIERKRSDEALRESELMYKTLVKAAPSAVTVIDLEGNIIEVSQQTLKLHGFDKAKELLGRSVFELFDPKDHKKAMINMQKTLKEGTSRNVEYSLLKKDGTCLTGILNTSLIKDTQGEPKAFIITTWDITEAKQAEETFRELAYYDALTGLPNKLGFSILAKQQLKLIERTKRSLLLLFADFNELNSISDNLGQHEGDTALVEIANILKVTFRKSDIVARVGKDKFVVLAIEASVENSEILLNRLKGNFAARNAGNNLLYKLSIDLGIISYNPESPCSIDELLGRADKQEYEQQHSIK